MKKITLAHFYNKLIVVILCVMGATVNTFAQCPTVTNSVLSFCDVETPTVANLAATDNGGGIKWYATATSTVQLSNTQGLQNDKEYFADDNSGTCGARQSVLIKIYGPPMSLPFQGVCVDYPEDATISDLLAFGNDVQWYNEATGGSPLAASTVLIDARIYYVNQSNPDTGCRTSRFSVFVNVGFVPVPTGDPIQVFCALSNPTVADLVASGENNWYATISSGTVLSMSKPLVNGESYYATTIDSPCESVERFKVTVDIAPINDAGNNGEIEICETGVVSTNTVNLFDALLGSPDSTGTWTGPLAIANDNIGTVDVTAMTEAGSPYVFTYSVSSDTCPTSTATVSIMITESGNPGSDGLLSLCINNPAQNLFDSLEGTPEPGGTWSPALASGTGIFDPAKDVPGIYTYTVQGVPPCGPATATVTVSVSPEAQPGTNGNLTLCSNSAPENLFNSLGGAPQSGGTWTPALKSGTGVFDPSKDAAGIYTYTVLGITPCGDATATVAVNITALPNPGTNGNLIVCSNDAPENLFTSLGGTPETGGIWSPALASGTGVFNPAQDAAGIYTYTINGISPCGAASATVTVTINPEAQPGTNGSLTLCMDSAPENLFDSLGGAPQSGGTWSPALASGSGFFDPSQDAAGIYTYNVYGVTPCGDATSTVTVSVNPLPNAGTNGSLVVCSNDPSQNLFDNLGGIPDVGGSWSPALASGTGIFNPAQDPAGTYTYTVKGALPCGEASASITVTVNPEAQPGINGNLALCIESAPEDLFNSLGGAPQLGGTWSPALTSGTGVFDPSQDAAGIYTYSILGITPCGNADATVTVTVNPLPIAGSNGNLIICSSDASVDLFGQLGGTPDAGGTWSPALASGTGIFNPAQDAAGIYTYTVKGISPCGNATATVEVTVNPGVEPGTNGSLTLCVASAPEDLFNSLGGTPQAGGTWSPALASGTGVFDPSQDAAGVYTYTITGIPPCGDATATVTVTVNPLPIAGSNGNLIICSSDATANLFDKLGGTPDAGGTWSPALASGTGVFNPAQDAAGIYTYTVKGASPCGNATATVEVTVNPGVEPGTNGSLTLCTDSAPEDLFISLGGTPQLGGTWSPALASGTGLFDPSQDAAGIYTYTITGIPPCGDATATVSVTVKALPNVGTNGSLIICSTDASQDLFVSLGGTPETGGTWSPALTSGTGFFDPTKDAAGTYAYSITTDCGASSATVEVTVNPKADPGTNGNLTLCDNNAPVDLFNSLGGTPQSGGIWSPALTSGTGVFDPSQDAGGIYTYTILGIAPCGDATSTVSVIINPLLDAGINGNLIVCENEAPQNLVDSLGGTPEPGGTWSPALASGTGIFDPAQDAAGTYTYTITTACGQVSATVAVTINPKANPGINGNLAICINGSPENLFDSLGGAPQSGGTWSPALASGTGIFNPLQDAAGIYTYTVSGIAPCGEATATVIVAIDTAPKAGFGGRFAICSNDAPQDLFKRLGGTPDLGGTWSPALASGSGIFDPAKDNGGSYTYTVTNACGTDSATVTVALIAQPDITGLILSANTICLDDALDINLSGAMQLADGNYSLSYALSGANTFEQTLTVNITNGTTTITLPASQLTTIGTTTFTLLNLLNPITNCGTASGTLPTVDFNIEYAGTPGLVNKGNVFCIEDAATIADLTTNLIGANIITWYDALENGTAFTADTPLEDGITYFASNMTISGCSDGVRLAVTVTIDLCEPLEIIIPDGFSPNGDNINDDFLIKNLRELYPNFKLQIYNRYGNILYKGDINSADWDGTSNQGREVGNGILPVGVYYYILELRDSNNKTIQGSVYLNR